MNPEDAWEVLTYQPSDYLKSGNRICTYFGQDSQGNDLIECEISDTSDECMWLDKGQFMAVFRNKVFQRLGDVV